MKDYHVNVFYSQKDGEYIADIPDLKYCSASGKTPLEALREVEDAKNSGLRLRMNRVGKSPTPHYWPAIHQLT